MPYEDDYKAWLEDMLIKMNPDWICDGMVDKEFTHKWCEENCGKDNAYIMPKCLHMYYHHIVRAEQTEPNCSEKPNNCEECEHWNDTEDGCADRHGCKDEPQTNADQHVQRVEYVGNDEKSRCWTCKHFERMHETPIASDGNYYTYVVCTAKECHYEPKTEPQTDCAWK